MGKIIDSSIFIAAERGKFDLLSSLTGAQPREPVALAAITASELVHGIYRASTAAIRARREAFVEQLLAAIPVIPFDLVVARVHARLWADLAAKGTPIGAHDLIIGATALSVGYDVATRNAREFKRIPGLTVVEW